MWVNGAALLEAAYPVTIDPEIGTNDLRISDMGPDEDTNFGAFDPAVAFNPTNNEYLVVWRGDDNTGTLVDNEREIFGQRIDATTGAETGANDFRISDMGTDGDVNFAAFNPAVAFNTTSNEYMVVWFGDDNTGALVDEEFEIFGQRFSVIPGPSIVSITADDPDDGDIIYPDSGYHNSCLFRGHKPACSFNKGRDRCLIYILGLPRDRLHWHMDQRFDPYYIHS